MSASFTINAPELVDSLAAETGRASRSRPPAEGQGAAAELSGASGLSPNGSFPRLLASVWPQEAPRLAALAAGMGLAREAAADVLQDVFLRALVSPPPLDRVQVGSGDRGSGDHGDGARSDVAGDCEDNRREQLVRWLFRVTANECRLAHRQSGRRQRLWSVLAEERLAAEKLAGELPAASDRTEDSAVSAIASVQFAELRREVDAALARLAEPDRLLVVLRYFLNWNSRQIAELVEQPESTVRGRLRACRLRLASELGEWNDAQ
jgi:RNA polymerase sigma factor (sigma-70 family)